MEGLLVLGHNLQPHSCDYSHRSNSGNRPNSTATATLAAHICVLTAGLCTNCDLWPPQPVLLPSPSWIATTPGLNLTVAALQCQVIYLFHHSRISLNHNTLSSTGGTNRPLETRYGHNNLGCRAAGNKSDAWKNKIGEGENNLMFWPPCVRRGALLA